MPASHQQQHAPVGETDKPRTAATKLLGLESGGLLPHSKGDKGEAGKVDLPMHGSHPVLVVRTKPPTEMLLFAQVPTHTLESLMVGAV
mmetsp:Transcript_79164/g.173589  ORF Transcript_79164/g.173589 Transcript_79164/m.173589 type:complete len:88 (-) Transcript_79164:151-414(-)